MFGLSLRKNEMKGKVSFQSQAEFISWLDAMTTAYNLESVEELVEMCPTTFPCVVTYAIVYTIISLTYVYESDFIR
jgi:hypothetical protein